MHKGTRTPPRAPGRGQPPDPEWVDEARRHAWRAFQRGELSEVELASDLQDLDEIVETTNWRERRHLAHAATSTPAPTESSPTRTAR